MSKPVLSFGLKSKKASSSKSKPAPSKRKPTFGDDDGFSDDDETKKAGSSGGKVEVITELDGFEIETPPAVPEPASKKDRLKNRNGGPPPPLSATKGSKASLSTEFGDLSQNLAARKHAEAAEALDPSIYDYDAVYDSLKPQKKETKEDVERRPKYMSSLAAAAAVRERDRLIAEEKRLAREREAEGDEFADKEKFVTEAYKKHQEENRRIEEEERRREEEEAKKNKNKGMTAFYKDMLEREDRAHAEVIKAAEEAKKAGPQVRESAEEEEKTEGEIAQEIIGKGGKITINEDGQVVDKRQLLQGGLNVGAKKKAEVQQQKSRHAAGEGGNTDQGRGVYNAGGKQGMRERQSRMLESQLEESLKRAREEEEEEKKKIELASKSRKTDADISSAKERYLARKKAAEEAKKIEAGEKP
ncbi:coiled-coil domain-containing protein 55-domain containing protein [Phialemonium atrogriseum]|uniref:Coiled-coil domain-containing protein 55-domain containing protein n=1 Tax=Phialemonium atrogriseum TaxID=1093897 RepID=A0AAJ0BWB5_9PEZI|nr:coiled-coil domain-containing protein 55-domain containing protein [Phialemonium atrogriseum]KAK1765669.1 coiled-coil domain-containing protein 55-domain containing protein [Phialemonium atrogriseum]